MDSPPLIKLEKVNKAFASHQALKDVDLSVASGARLGIYGPNGGGKSTLLMVIAGLIKPSSGRAQVCGEAAHALPLRQSGKIGLVLARPGLYELLTARENLHHFGALYGLSEAQVDAKAEALCAKVSLRKQDLDRRSSVLSSGVQQKIAILRALLTDPQ